MSSDQLISADVIKAVAKRLIPTKTSDQKVSLPLCTCAPSRVFRTGSVTSSVGQKMQHLVLQGETPEGEDAESDIEENKENPVDDQRQDKK